MVFWSSWAKKVRESVSKLTFDKLKNRVNTIENKYVKKDESNTLTQTNTFNGNTYFRNRVDFNNDRNNNGVYISNFDYYNDNYTALKFTNNGANMLQIECDNTTNKATISSPTTSNGLSIQNLDNPTRNDNATNKGYVDNLFNPLNNKVNSVIQGLQNGNIINYEGNYSSTKTYHLAQAITYNGDWFVSTIDNNLNHTPNKSNTNYWVYISQPNVDLSQYLTISSANATYATQNSVSQLETHTIQLVNNLDNRITTNQNNITNLTNNKADTSYVNNLITYSTSYQLYNNLTWLNTKSENNRNWRWVGRLNTSIVPNNLIDIHFELQGYSFNQTHQWYELIKYGWYKADSYIIIWIESPESTLDDYNMITQNTYIRFIQKR